MPRAIPPFDTIVARRLEAQHLAGARLKTPAELVSWFGAIQAQDYAGVKWAVAQRLGDVTDEEMDRALDRGELLRTHILRPTWHLVHPADIRWMLEITSPRVRTANAYRGKKLGLEANAFTKSTAALRKRSAGGRR
jgi:hypothetical protein